jgi:hypothetical protein
VVAVHLPNSFDHAVNGSEVPAPHGVIRNEERFAQLAQLQGDEFGRRLRLMPGERLTDKIAHALDGKALAQPGARARPSRRAPWGATFWIGRGEAETAGSRSNGHSSLGLSFERGKPPL